MNSWQKPRFHKSWGPVVILTLLALGGILLSLFAGWREADQFQAIAKLRIGEAVDAHFATAADHLRARQSLAEAAAALFSPPPLSYPHPLGDHGDKIIAFAPEIDSVAWLPEIDDGNMPEALTALKNAGSDTAQFVDRDNKPITPDSAGRPLYPVIDIAPDESRNLVGMDIGSFPEHLAAITQAKQTRAVVRATSLQLPDDHGNKAFWLYAPVFDPGGTFHGVLVFGDNIETLFNFALTAPANFRNFTIKIRDPASNQTLFLYDTNGDAQSAAPQDSWTKVERTAEFAGRPLAFIYLAPRDLNDEAFWRAFGVTTLGLTLTAVAIAGLAFMVNRTEALAREVEWRSSAEDRLKVLIHELNHRVRNVMSVAQAVVRLSFTTGSSLDNVQNVCEGRLQALANAMTQLTASNWQGISLRNLITKDILPFSERIETSGSDLQLRARSAQTFALLLHELAANAAKHGALSVAEGRVRLEWAIDRSGTEPDFILKWREMNGPPVSPPSRRGFGELLVRRIAPRDLSGHATIHYAARGFEYELRAPLREVTHLSGAKAA